MTDDPRSYAPDLGRLTDAADDSFSVRRAYGEPYQHEGQLIVPVAKVWGGIGTGSGGGAGTGAGSGSAGGTGRGSGKGALPEWKRSFRVGSSEAPAEGGPDTGSTGGDASGETEGEAKGEAHGEGSGSGGGGGGGYGLRVKPIGVFVVSAEGTRWQPVLDLNKVILGGQAVGIAAALALGWALGRRRR
ncbi:hypothetical protein [Isoptericola sp. BMS4]|uniref:hypothetical protein n=1 Tax=Isoptericola sp. BMS4 TaxID=2527875 RepID=UPI0014248AFF|nr:hypothetical protein [Isoptericola sp. BMS4]